MLDIKIKAPDFTLQDQDGVEHTLSSYQGKFVLLYFYPKDNTPGCTRQACSIKDSFSKFKKADIQVLGISKDSVASHKKFADKFALPFTILSDEEQDVINVYGADRHPIGTKRVSYLINPKGVIVKAYPKVIPEDHVKEILRDVVEFS